ncbi:hypothetical protein ACWEO2_06685 [Nocardia sp. NPDC004278]
MLFDQAERVQVVETGIGDDAGQRLLMCGVLVEQCQDGREVGAQPSRIAALGVELGNDAVFTRTISAIASRIRSSLPRKW